MQNCQQVNQNWYAAYVRHQHEFLVEDSLKSKGIEYFLPERKVTRHWSDRKKIIREPLFKGYLFVNANQNDLPLILESRGVICFLGNGQNRPEAIPVKDIQALQKFTSENIMLDAFPYLKSGMRAKIRKGPLKDIEGFIVRKKKECRLILSIELMKQSVALEVDEAILEVCK